ncbi:hypothetical protein KM043_008855 [Ampulex compressa]|nr:hypothetical protein KM043_008855 [Ampulex compressa]
MAEKRLARILQSFQNGASALLIDFFVENNDSYREALSSNEKASLAVRAIVFLKSQPLARYRAVVRCASSERHPAGRFGPSQRFDPRSVSPFGTRGNSLEFSSAQIAGGIRDPPRGDLSGKIGKRG